MRGARDELAAERDVQALREALLPAYVLDREIGRGGMATVYLAEDRKHERQVAIKVLHHEMAIATGLDRFLREIGLTARLSHPHILPLLDSGLATGRPFYVMPFVEGLSLRQYMDRAGQLPLEEALRIAYEVADALAYAHAQGVVHRDIKPENILLSGRHALVADFGIARAMHAVAANNNLTQLGLIIGTPAYMSPEQAVGETTLDGRSDVCSLGVVLYEMLVASLPFNAGGVRGMLARLFTESVPSARVLRPQLPHVVEQLLATAMARDAVDRFASAAEFADSLMAVERALSRDTGSTIALTTHVPHIPSLAVLPFENLSSDPENAYLSDGIAEDVLTMLARKATLRVCARTSSFAFRGKDIDLQTLGARLGVRLILTGSVRRAGERLRVSAQLVNAADGMQLWSERYDRLNGDVFAIQDEIAAAIVEAINAQLLAMGHAQSIARPTVAERTTSVEAYELCLRGRHLWQQRTAHSAERAVACYESAIVLDGQYAHAWSGLANVWATRAVYGTIAPGDAMERAREAAQRALAIDPRCAEAYCTLGLVEAAFDWRWDAAEASFQRAIALDPNYPTAHQWYATNFLVPNGRLDDALDALRVALRLDPLSLPLKTSLASAFFYGRRFSEAATAARDALELDAGFPLAHFFLGQALMQLGEYEAGLAACATAVSLSGRSGETLAALGHARAVTGDEAGARSILAELAERAATGYVSPSHPALVHVGLGAWERALECLETAVQSHAADLSWIGVRPTWDALRGNPRFRDVMRQVGVTLRSTP